MSRTNDANVKIPEHEEAIVKFLYDDGPHTSEQICEHMNMSASHISRILGLMKETGSIVCTRLGNPPMPYWILTEDAL